MRRCLPTLILGFGLLAPLPLHSQAPAALADSIGRLRHQLAELSGAADSARQARLTRPRVLLIATPLRIEAESRAAVVLATQVTKTLGEFEAMYGHVSLAAEPTLVLRSPDSARLTQGGFRTHENRLLAAGDSLNEGLLLTAEQLLDGLGARLETRALAAAPTLARWVGGPWATAPRAQVMTAGYEALIVSRSRSARACAQKDDAACERALGLVPIGWPEWKAEFGVGTRRQMALELMAGHATRTAIEVQCDTGDQNACDAMLREDRERAGEFALAQPAARASLLRLAAARAGALLWSRLAADSGPPTLARLADAARMTQAELLSAWRQELRGSRPPAMVLSAMTLVGLALWLTLLLAVAGGLSRWR